MSSDEYTVEELERVLRIATSTWTMNINVGDTGYDGFEMEIISEDFDDLKPMLARHGVGVMIAYESIRLGKLRMIPFKLRMSYIEGVGYQDDPEKLSESKIEELIKEIMDGLRSPGLDLEHLQDELHLDPYDTDYTTALTDSNKYVREMAKRHFKEEEE